MDELIGKGLDVWIIVQLLVYMSATLVPLALPLSILLASIMTFGNMGENFELVAIKSSGISLLRFMRPLFIFIFITSIGAFVFNNNVIPVANLNALSLLHDVRNSKPTLSIKPGQFNTDIPNFAVRVGKKDDDGYTIYDVLIYDHTDLVGNNKVILAKKGKMLPSSDKLSLVFRLEDGWRYEEGRQNGSHDPEMSQTRMKFKSLEKIIDLSSLQFTRTNQDLFKNAYQMMDVVQLSQVIDSIKKTDTDKAVTVTSYLAPYYTLHAVSARDTELAKKISTTKATTTLPATYQSSFINNVPEAQKMNVAQASYNNIRNFKSTLDNFCQVNDIQKENAVKFKIEFHRKFALSFACLLLFLIGAPLGAIIRKGGLGLPLVFAVALFITFYILNINGEKLAKSYTLAPWAGMWLSTFIMLPGAIWLINSARNDSQVMSIEPYKKAWQAVKTKFSKPAKP